MDEPRVKAFRALKPPCVELSQVAVKFKAKKVSNRELSHALEEVLDTLQEVALRKNALDPKLADYVFFPLSHILRDAKDMPMRVVEVALTVLQVLIAKGWKAGMVPDTSKQLLVLLCFLAGGHSSDGKITNVNEEIGTIAFQCLGTLFQFAGTAGLEDRGSVSTQNVPVLGHSVLVLLDGSSQGASVNVRLAALTALEGLVKSITDLEALRNVLPGMVSALTKSLSSSHASKSSYKIITRTIDILTIILRKVMGHEASLSNAESKHPDQRIIDQQTKPTGSWIEATSHQVKMALASILPLRYHERSGVRTSLSRLCTMIIRNCRRTLQQSIPMMVDTLVILYSNDTDGGSAYTLTSVFASDTQLLEMLKVSLHDWIAMMPRIMASKDDTRKSRLIVQICAGFKILETQGASLEILNDHIAYHLRASVSSAIQSSATKFIRDVPEGSTQIAEMLLSSKRLSEPLNFDPVLFSESSSTSTMTSLRRLALQLKALPTTAALHQNVISSLHSTTGHDQLAILWLALEVVSQNDATDIQMLDQYLNISNSQASPLLDQTYAFALDNLSQSTFSTSQSSQLQALCLEAIALQARNQGSDFRPELVDALYPILERLGSNDAALQRHAMTSLSIISQACEYPSAAALIVDNADYLVNATAVKLNTFNVSPQASQVLVMMVRLCGSALIPYLDDLVESIFSILACYHGYPKLVESMFEVLNAVVEEASKGPVTAIEGEKGDTTSRPMRYHSSSIDDIASLLRFNRDIAARPISPPAPQPSASSKGAPDQLDSEDQETNVDESNELSPADLPAFKPTKTTQLITSITILTPAHLSTPSPPLRANILSLLSRSFPLLARETDTFLPIAATLWLPITTRLFSDNESYIILAAAKALAVMCSCAGDFLASRVGEIWGRLRELYERTEEEMKEGMRGQRGLSGMKWRVWDAVVELMLVLVKDVGLSEEKEDAIFEVLGPLISYEAGMAQERKNEIRECLGGLNADVFWLLEAGNRFREHGERLKRPADVDGLCFSEINV